MAVRMCRPCWKDKGRARPAYELVAGVPYCDECFAEIGKEPAFTALPATKAEANMAENCNCGRLAIYRGRCWARRGLPGPVSREAGGGKSPRRKKSAASRNGSADNGAAGSSLKERMLADLRGRRDALDEAIATIERLEI